MDPVEALERIAFLLERGQAATFRVRAFRTAARVVAGTSRQRLVRHAQTHTLAAVEGLGPRTAQVVTEALAGRTPTYLADLQAQAGPLAGPGRELLARLRGDCHLHSDWSDGGSPIESMARGARGLGREWAALTDHSPGLTVAHGLSAARLRRQVAAVAEVNARVAPFRLLTGIECDILPDGSLDQDRELLAELDVVVASVHSRLGMDAEAMTRRMLAAVRDPLVDVLGHCTGRLVGGRKRAPSRFDAQRVFAACAESGTAVEINGRPDRLDPPRPLLREALDAGALFAVDSDAHAPGQLEWQAYGCDRAREGGVPAERIVTTWTAERLLAWSRERRAA